MEKLKRKPLSKGSPMEGEGFKEKVSFEFRVEKSRSDGQ